jgi:hypothetical protein
MSASIKPYRPLIYYPISRNDGVMDFALKKGKSWLAKLDEITTAISALELEISACLDTAELDQLEFCLGGLKAAKMVCSNHLRIELSQRNKDTSEAISRIYAENAEWMPIGFCRYFWVVENSKGQKKAKLRGSLIKIEEALTNNAKSSSDAYLLSQVFQFMFSYSALSNLKDLANDTHLKSAPERESTDEKLENIANGVLLKLVGENMLPLFAKISVQPNRERNKQIKALRKSLIKAFDLAAGNNKREIHASAEVVEWTNADGIKSSVLPAWTAIQYAKKYLAEFQSLPKKADIRNIMKENHESLNECKDSFWTKVWIESGLSDLPDGTSWSNTQKDS